MRNTPEKKGYELDASERWAIGRHLQPLAPCPLQSI